MRWGMLMYGMPATNAVVLYAIYGSPLNRERIIRSRQKKSHNCGTYIPKGKGEVTLTRKSINAARTTQFEELGSLAPKLTYPPVAGFVHVSCSTLRRRSRHPRFASVRQTGY